MVLSKSQVTALLWLMYGVRCFTNPDRVHNRFPHLHRNDNHCITVYTEAVYLFSPLLILLWIKEDDNFLSLFLGYNDLFVYVWCCCSLTSMLHVTENTSHIHSDAMEFPCFLAQAGFRPLWYLILCVYMFDGKAARSCLMCYQEPQLTIKHLLYSAQMWTRVGTTWIEDIQLSFIQNEYHCNPLFVPCIAVTRSLLFWMPLPQRTATYTYELSVCCDTLTFCSCVTWPGSLLNLRGKCHPHPLNSDTGRYMCSRPLHLSSVQSATVHSALVQSSLLQSSLPQHSLLQTSLPQSISLQSSILVSSVTVYSATVQSATVYFAAVQSGTVYSATVQSATTQSATVQSVTVYFATVQSATV